ncbi:MAG: type II toxin-antitoxin system PemK/MazF family toxin [bacterium]
MNRGDIVLISVPFSDLTSQKVRPALVVSPVDPSENDIIVALITTNISEEVTDKLLNRAELAVKTGPEVGILRFAACGWWVRALGCCCKFSKHIFT